VATLFGSSSSLQVAGRSRAFCCYEEAVDPTFRFMTLDWDGQINTGENA
jgi:phosphoglucomutase